MKPKIVWIALFACCLLCGCAREPIEKQPARTPAVIPAAVLSPTPSPLLPLSLSPVPTPLRTPIPTPSPTPVPALPEGDFSLAFPRQDTGAGAYKSFQSDEARVAIERVSHKGVTYYVADIWIKRIDSFRTAFAKDKFQGGKQTMKTLMKNHNALLAISGDYYGARKRGVVIRNGEAYRDTPLYDVCVLYRNGEMKTYTNDEWASIQDTARGVYQAWGFGPMLLDENSMPLDKFNGFDWEKRNPRAALGYYQPGHYCFVLVDGRTPSNSKGMLLSELSVLFRDLGCKAAYNLDGGASAILAFDGKYVNEPSNGGRTQYDIIYIGAPEKETEAP